MPYVYELFRLGSFFFNRKGRKGAAKVAEFFSLRLPRLPRSEAYRGSLRKNLAFFAVPFLSV